jgi:hypothetical protein
MECNSQALVLAYTFVNPCFSCEPKVRIATSVNEPSGDKAFIQQTSHFVITIMLHALVLL